MRETMDVQRENNKKYEYFKNKYSYIYELASKLNDPEKVFETQFVVFHVSILCLIIICFICYDYMQNSYVYEHSTKISLENATVDVILYRENFQKCIITNGTKIYCSINNNDIFKVLNNTKYVRKYNNEIFSEPNNEPIKYKNIIFIVIFMNVLIYVLIIYMYYYYITSIIMKTNFIEELENYLKTNTQIYDRNIYKSFFLSNEGETAIIVLHVLVIALYFFVIIIIFLLICTISFTTQELYDCEISIIKNNDINKPQYIISYKIKESIWHKNKFEKLFNGFNGFHNFSIPLTIKSKCNNENFKRDIYEQKIDEKIFVHFPIFLFNMIIMSIIIIGTTVMGVFTSYCSEDCLNSILYKIKMNEHRIV